jgi:hypothetical protein
MFPVKFLAAPLNNTLCAQEKRMKVQLRETVLALALCTNLVVCERTEIPRTSQSERQGTGNTRRKVSKCPVVGNSATRICHLPGDRNYGQMPEENKNK